MPKLSFLSTSPPSIFVSRTNYPDVDAAIVSPPFTDPDSWKYDSCSYYLRKNFKERDIIDFRSNLKSIISLSLKFFLR